MGGSASAQIGEVIDTGALGHHGGAALAVSGSTLYVGGMHGLVVFDISNPDAPSPVAGPIETGAFGHDGKADMKVVGNRLYAAGKNGLATFDISNPQAPRAVGAAIETGVLGFQGGAAIEAAYEVLFLAGGKGLTLGFPEEPVRIGSIIETGVLGAGADEDAGACALAIKHNALYVAGMYGLGVFDLASVIAARGASGEPTPVGGPIETGALSYNGECALAVVGSRLFVAGSNGLALLDVSNPLAPSPVGAAVSTGANGGDGGVALAPISESKIFIAGRYGLVLGNYKDPASPEFSDVIDTGVLGPEGSAALKLVGNRLFVAGRSGLAVFDVDAIFKAVAEAKDDEEAEDWTIGSIAFQAAAA